MNTLSFTNGAGGGMVTTRQYDKLNRLQSITSKSFGAAAATLPVSFGYQHNRANQRIRADLEDGSYWIYQYDALGQVVSGRKYWADNTAVDGQQFDYAFDDIGNRTTTGGRTSAVSTYTRNFLNQYSQRTVSDKADVLGVANPTAGVTVGIQGGAAYTAARKGDYFHYPLTIGNNVYPTIEVKSLYGATQTETGEIFNPPATEIFAHDADGNLTQDGRWTYVWDGENRLVEMYRDTSTPTPSSRLRLTFEYDHQGRRIRKTFFTHNGTTWVEQADTVFLYDGWNLLGELDANASNAKLRTYIWGLDLSGTMEGGGLSRQSGAAAGGVGGLLKVTDYTSGTTHHFVAYDGNGNVIALVAGASGAITARYEYGPFGEPLRRTGNLARNNPFRFSTKFTENESGLVYYGFRFYDATIGRWLSRDPISERGGKNLYRFVENTSIRSFDFIGLCKCGVDSLKFVPNPGWKATEYHFDAVAKFKSDPGYDCGCCAYVQFVKPNVIINGNRRLNDDMEIPPNDNTWHIDVRPYNGDKVTKNYPQYADHDTSACGFLFKDTPGIDDSYATNQKIDFEITLRGQIVDICRKNPLTGNYKVVKKTPELKITIRGTKPNYNKTP